MAACDETEILLVTMWLGGSLDIVKPGLTVYYNLTVLSLISNPDTQDWSHEIWLVKLNRFFNLVRNLWALIDVLMNLGGTIIPTIVA